jgi:actin-related protein
MNEEGLPIVIDNGSYSCKAGVSGDDAPRSSFPSVVGKLPHHNSIFSCKNESKDWYVGEEALDKKYALSL